MIASGCVRGGHGAFWRSAGPASAPRCVRAKAYSAGVRLSGVGSSVPETRLSNADLEQLVETSDEWITKRTGIRARHVLSQGEKISHHATEAARRALEMARVAPEEVDMILLCTSTPDDVFGSATTVQAGLGANKAVAMDLTAACSGFVLGLITAGAYVRSGMAKNVLLVGADCLTRFVDWNDRGTCILFGDGAGAVLVQATDAGRDGLLGHAMHSDGHGLSKLCCTTATLVHKPGLAAEGRAARAEFENIQMNGQEVFKFAVRAVPQVLDEALAMGGLTKDDVDWMVLHQANQRILDSAAERYSFPQDRVISNLGEYGNTSAASIPLALDEAVRGGKIQPGDTLAFAGFGAGLTWASAIAKWQ